jgi:hypothetical protein
MDGLARKSRDGIGRPPRLAGHGKLDGEHRGDKCDETEASP